MPKPGELRSRVESVRTDVLTQQGKTRTCSPRTDWFFRSQKGRPFTRGGYSWTGRNQGWGRWRGGALGALPPHEYTLFLKRAHALEEKAQTATIRPPRRARYCRVGTLGLRVAPVSSRTRLPKSQERIFTSILRCMLLSEALGIPATGNLSFLVTAWSCRGLTPTAR